MFLYTIRCLVSSVYTVDCVGVRHHKCVGLLQNGHKGITDKTQTLDIDRVTEREASG